MKDLSTNGRMFYRYCFEQETDGECLYLSVLKILSMDFEYEQYHVNNLREWVANYIRNNKYLHGWIDYSNTKENQVEWYCRSIEKGKLWGGELELRALAFIIDRIICCICMRKDGGKTKVEINWYGLEELPTKQYVCILHDIPNAHFEPLYIANMNNEDMEMTQFEKHDKDVTELLKNFIENELKYYGEVQLTPWSEANGILNESCGESPLCSGTSQQPPIENDDKQNDVGTSAESKQEKNSLNATSTKHGI